MRIFLIDFENVHSEGMAGVDSLTDNDEVVIFYSANADSVTFELLHKLMFCKARLRYFKIRRGGRNALDFQLSSFLGYLISKHGENAEFYLISKDNGFDFVMDFWESGCIDVKPDIKRFATVRIMLASEGKKPEKIEKAEKIEKVEKIEKAPEVQVAVIVENSSDIDEKVEKLLSDSKSSHELYISTVKTFGQKKGVEIYRNIKSRFFAQKTG
ncbi:MAG: PIN domain-containing protein [Oscillospiraceae bacterium]|nr:PIN domain-containing protein [Oscillospiraceae bacterium]